MSNIQHCHSNYERGKIVQAAQTLLTIGKIPEVVLETEQEHRNELKQFLHFRDELFRLVRNETQDHKFYPSDNDSVTIAKLIIFLAEGYMPEE